MSAGSRATVPRNTIMVGDALEVLRRLPEASVDCCITSPPYFLLRNYDAGPDELGTEPTVDDYVQRLVAVMDEVGRVLRPHGSAWLNLGDSYSRHPRYGAPAKSLLLAPERVLMALLKRGWIVRSKVVWSKPNPMPASVADRLASTWEPLFHLVRRRTYYFDLDAIREPHRSSFTPATPRAPQRPAATRPAYAGPLAGSNDGLARARAEGRPGHPLGRNPGDVWRVATAGFRGAHFAVFPEKLIERPLLATCPERVCTRCERPWQRQTRRDRLGQLRPACACRAPTRSGLVLDPYMGAGTTALVAQLRGRDYLGIELNAEFAELANRRLAGASQARAA